MSNEIKDYIKEHVTRIEKQLDRTDEKIEQVLNIVTLNTKSIIELKTLRKNNQAWAARLFNSAWALVIIGINTVISLFVIKH